MNADSVAPSPSTSMRLPQRSEIPAKVMPWALYTEQRRWIMLALLSVVYASSGFDVYVFGILFEPIKHDFHLSDELLGFLSGVCLLVPYALVALPVARWAERGDRRLIVTLALGLWSMMTALCGLAQSFWQLAVARAAVGAGESGSIPTAQSLIADYFPPEQRGRAFGIWYAAASPATLLGYAAGGYMTTALGWRMALIVAGLTNLPLALLSYVGLREPRARLGFPKADDRESFRESMRKLRTKSSFLYLLAACILYSFGFGAVAFFPSFMIRSLHVPLAQTGLAFGMVLSVASLVGQSGGGWLADRLARRDVRWLARLAGLAYAAGGGLQALALIAPTYQWFLALTFCALTAIMIGLAPLVAGVHAVCGQRRRATAVALVLFIGVLFGAVGQYATGLLSDAFSLRDPVGGLRDALTTMMLAIFLAAPVLLTGARALPSNLEA